MALESHTLLAPWGQHRVRFTPWPDGTVEVQDVAWVGHPHAAWLDHSLPRRQPVGEARSLWVKLRQAGWTRLG